MTSYILEVQRFDIDSWNQHPEWCRKAEHIGYMNKVFKTKNDAASYYNKHNPHMRPLNAHHNWKSDWDENTYLQYIVRQHYNEYLKIPPFDINDAPEINIRRDDDNKVLGYTVKYSKK